MPAPGPRRDVVDVTNEDARVALRAFTQIAVDFTDGSRQGAGYLCTKMAVCPLIGNHERALYDRHGQVRLDRLPDAFDRIHLRTAEAGPVAGFAVQPPQLGDRLQDHHELRLE